MTRAQIRTGFTGRVLVSSRSFDEYCENFSLSPADLLAGPVLDCPGGASNFGATLRALGGTAVSIDPQYARPPKSMRELLTEELARVARWVAQQPERFQLRDGAWPLGDLWRSSADAFLADYEADRQAGSGWYLTGSLPSLPFADRSFSLVLSGFLLFTYADRFDENFHLQSIIELLRVCRGEVRLHPLNDSKGTPYPHLDRLLKALTSKGVAHRMEHVRSRSDPLDDRTLIVGPPLESPNTFQ